MKIVKYLLLFLITLFVVFLFSYSVFTIDEMYGVRI